jgi:hypothetical protein
VRSIRLYRYWFSALALISLISCAPIPRDYHKPFYEGGELKTTGCGSSGPAEKISISLPSEVEITARSSSTEPNEKYANFYLYASITAPDGVEFSFDSNEIIISDILTGRKWVLVIAELYTSPNNVKDKNAKNFYFKNGNLVVPATASIIGSSYIQDTWFKDKKYNFGATLSLSTKEIDTYLEDFTVSFPPLVIDGITVELKPIRFKHVKYIVITPLNC